MGSGGVVHGRNGRIQKGRGDAEIIQPSVPGFRTAANHADHPSPDFAAPPDATILLAVGVVLPPFGRLDVNMLVDVERVPNPGAAFRLSAASSNTLNPPVIRPYPLLHHTLLKIHAPTPQMGRCLSII
jgi:hypothetical protein